MSNPIDLNYHTWLKSPQPLFICGSVITAIVAVLAEGTGNQLGLFLLTVCVVTICSWAVAAKPTLELAVVVTTIALVTLGWTVQEPEPALFQSILLAAAVGWQIKKKRLSVLLLLVLASIPPLCVLKPNGADWGWWNWTIGTLFSWTFGRLIYLLEVTLNELTAARGQLVEVAAREERRRISRDVHDLVGHSITAMLLNVRAARRDFEENPTESLQALADAEKTGIRGMEDIRAAMVGLRSDIVTGKQDKSELMSIPNGESIQRLLDWQSHLSIKTTGDLHRLQGPLGVAVYRTLQECITNITKHSKDGTGNIQLDIDIDAVKLYADNPIAKSIKSVPGSNKTLGLISMNERVTGQGGNFLAEVNNGRWYLKCRIPINV